MEERVGLVCRKKKTKQNLKEVCFNKLKRKKMYSEQKKKRREGLGRRDTRIYINYTQAVCLYNNP